MNSIKDEVMKVREVILILMLFFIPIYMAVNVILEYSDLFFRENEHQMFDESIQKGLRYNSRGHSSNPIDHPLIALPNFYSASKGFYSIKPKSNYTPKHSIYSNVSIYKQSTSVLGFQTNETNSNFAYAYNNPINNHTVKSSNLAASSNQPTLNSTSPSLNFASIENNLGRNDNDKKLLGTLLDQSPFVPLADRDGLMREDQDPGGNPVGDPIPVSDGLGLLAGMALAYHFMKLKRKSRTA